MLVAILVLVAIEVFLTLVIISQLDTAIRVLKSQAVLPLTDLEGRQL